MDGLEPLIPVALFFLVASVIILMGLIGRPIGRSHFWACKSVEGGRG